MTSSNKADGYTTGAAFGARREKQGDKWTLVLERELRHPPALVWQALTDPAQLAQWAPFDADRNMAHVGTVKLTTVGAPQTTLTEATVKRAEPMKLLEYTWVGNDMRWELEAKGAGTRLTLWINIADQFVAWGAAGWHVCFDVLDRLLAGDPIGRLAGPDAMKLPAWQRLTGEYAKELGVALPSWGA